MSSLSIDQIEAFVYREARLLDDRDWDAWLECYSPSAVFWMPTWDDNDRLTEDPHSEMSLIYYPNREGLEDRVFRIKTERSGASTPEPRTSHNISNVELVSDESSTVDIRFNWLTLNQRYDQTTMFFGCSFYTLEISGEAMMITYKKVVLKNDNIHQVIDIYHI